LLTGPPELLREALCHEAAHAAVYELHGRVPRPHGREWRDLMQTAGFEPRTRMPATHSPHVSGRHTGSRGVWNHRCPVCHMSRAAHRPVNNWRCAQCRAAGLEGTLIVTRIDGPGRGAR
jgi:predicted SprT family Zn-dependent metalloprotease